MRTKTRPISILIAIVMLLAIVATTSAAPLAKGDPPNGQVTIIRDEYGVPHVFGSTNYSLFYGIGYAQGQDRLWQADLLRRTGDGTLAELLGPSALSGDVQARTLWGPAEFRAQMLKNASPDTQLMFQAYADGMNAWITKATKTGKLPVEYSALGLPPPRPWTTDDSIAVVMVIFAQFGQSGADELTDAAQLQAFDAHFGPLDGLKVFNDTHWLDDPSAPTTIPAEGAAGPVRSFSAPKVKLPPDLEKGLDQWKELQQGWENNMQRLGIQNPFASNAMLISPRLTADGRALLLGGPQMGYSVPQISMEIGAHSGGYNADGITFAGLPTVAIGMTDNFAWTFTSGISDNSDIYYEVLNPNNPGQYLFDGSYRDFDCSQETFHIL